MNLIIAITSALLLFGYLMVAIEDIRNLRIPNYYLSVLLVVTILNLIATALIFGNSIPIIRGLISCFLTFVALLILNSGLKNQIGMGDIKFGAILSLGIGQWSITASIASMALAFLFGGFFSIVRKPSGNSKPSLPFAPFMVTGTLVMYGFIIASNQYF